jgi:hypothetical protein
MEKGYHIPGDLPSIHVAAGPVASRRSLRLKVAALRLQRTLRTANRSTNREGPRKKRVLPVINGGAADGLD